MADEQQSKPPPLRMIGQAFLAKVAQRLATINPAELDAADVARWTDVALKLEQAGSQRGSYDRQAALAETREAPAVVRPDPDLNAGE